MTDKEKIELLTTALLEAKSQFEDAGYTMHASGIQDTLDKCSEESTVEYSYPDIMEEW